MRRLLLSTLLALVTTLTIAGLASAQTGPEFQLGFKALADQIPTVVGTPLENEHFDVANGDSVQHTTTGLMVWRKADNVTAFTNGATTWLVGPLGLQSRPNTTRFDWEKAAPPATLPQGTVTLNFSRAANGWTGLGTILNPLDTPMDAEINAVGYNSPGGTPVVDVPTTYVAGLAPGSSRGFSVAVPANANVGSWSISVVSRPVAARSSFTMDVGAGKNLNVDPALAGAVDTLRTVADGDSLVKTAAQSGVQVTHGPTGPGVLGDFDPFANVVTIASGLDSTSALVRATVLAHELQHAADAAAGNLPSTPVQCYREEATAFERQAAVWTLLWKNNLPPDFDTLHAEMNDVTNTLASDPQAFVAQLVRRYRSECGPVSQPGQILP